jgi:diguanylate cyclase (GGDEF)-like protein
MNINIYIKLILTIFINYILIIYISYFINKNNLLFYNLYKNFNKFNISIEIINIGILIFIFIVLNIYVLKFLYDFFKEINTLKKVFKLALENKKKYKIKIEMFKDENIKELTIDLNTVLIQHNKNLDYSKYIKKMEKERSYLKETAELDSLTKLYNRHKFNQISLQEFRNALVKKQNLSLIMFDIDHFKLVNDNYGHDIGDIIIKAFTHLAKHSIKNKDIIARWGGEEFVILLPNTTLKEAGIVSERIRKKIENYNFPKINKKTGSFGVSTLNLQIEIKDNIDKMIKRADEALYMAKNNGRNKTYLEYEIKSFI